MKQFLITLICLLAAQCTLANLKVKGVVNEGKNNVEGASITVQPGNYTTTSGKDGGFELPIPAGDYELTVTADGYAVFREQIHVSTDIVLNIQLQQKRDNVLKELTVTEKSDLASGKLRDVTGSAIYAGKKTEVIYLSNINANLATNNTRQIYARIPGLNIWEYDRGGLQLGVGGRGLSPNRSSNFNIRQNGYDISADALGYPESYYTPSAEALERIEIVRGAAGLQYGPQFGGLVNFVMKEGPLDKKLAVTTRQTYGSWGLFNSFNSLGGTIANGKINYYTFYQFKTGYSWRPNSHYTQHNAYGHVGWEVTEQLKLTAEYTFMNYLAQQPGGLTDAQYAADPSVSVRARNWFRVNWNLVNFTADYKISPRTRINCRNYMLYGGREALGILSYINRPDNGGKRDYQSDVYNNYSSEIRLIHQYDLLKTQLNTLLVGARLYKGITYRRQGDASDAKGADFAYVGKEPSKSAYHFPGSNVALFAENVFKISPTWSLTPGIRFEHINTKADGYYYKQNIFVAPEKILESKSNPRSFFLAGIGTAYKTAMGIEAYANFSTNYRSINFNDIRVVNTNARVDPALRDETGFNADLGVRGKPKNWLYCDVSVFYLQYNGRIGSIFSRDTDFMTYRLRTNVADSRNIGLETMMEFELFKALKLEKKQNLSVYTSFSLIDARYINTKNTAISGKLVENVPPVLFRSGCSFGNKKYNLTYQFAWQAKQYSDATNTEITPTAVDGAIPAFSVMDLSASYTWKQFTLYCGANNLTNAKYFTRRADGYPGPGILPADRRNLYMTLQYKM